MSNLTIKQWDKIMLNSFYQPHASNVLFFYENIGGTVFPITYHSDGIVTVDYPEQPIAKKLTEEGRNNLDKLNNELNKLFKK